MSESSGYALLLNKEREQVFLAAIASENHFAEPVPDFLHSRNAPLLCIVISPSGAITHLGLASRGVRAGTAVRRLNVWSILPLAEPVSTDAILSILDSRVTSKAQHRLTRGGLMPPATFSAIVEALGNLSAESRAVLDRFRQSRAERIRRISDRARESLAVQQQATLTSLAIAGFDRKELQEWAPPEVGPPSSFLDGLPSARLREDPMVINDLTRIPGFELIRTLPYSAAIFQSPTERLTVVLANRLPLEEQTGTDLIYFNETFKSFVLVQYKAMERSGGEEAEFRLPSTQLDEEIRRMEHLLRSLRACAPNDNRDGFRLTENPFFLKLCPRMVFHPDSVGLVPGMYLPLDYWTLLVGNPGLEGPRGGRRVTYQNVGRYFDNTEFINLVAKAWVGTNANQSAVLEAVIRDVVGTGQTVTIAIKTEAILPSDPSVSQPPAR